MLDSVAFAVPAGVAFLMLLLYHERLITIALWLPVLLLLSAGTNTLIVSALTVTALGATAAVVSPLQS